jgi:hypothetical protein
VVADEVALHLAGLGDGLGVDAPLLQEPDQADALDIPKRERVASSLQ